MSTINLRNYQKYLTAQVFEAWRDGHTNVLVQSHTGSGKTVILTHIVEQANTPTVIMAHRMELVSQLSLALARAEIPHNIISPHKTIGEIIRLHLQLGSRHYYKPTAPVVVASVDTLVRRSTPWANQIKLVVVDESAHVLRANKWGRAVAMFPQARTLLVTATPLRADGKGLGRVGEGIADILIQGPSMRELIDEGYLSTYRIFAPPNSLDLSPVTVTASGDYSPAPLRQAVDKAHITGDIVTHYLRHGAQQGSGLGITFAVSVDAAHELATAYNAAGVPAVCLHADTGISERASVMKRFREGVIKQLVNVDILTEGVDVPAVSCVSLCRPTLSYGLHMQQIGRALRPADGKTHAVILDHVGNVLKHGMPDEPRAWTLASRDRKSRGANGTMPVRTCLNAACVAVFPRNLDRCPYCRHPVPLSRERSTPAQVDGNLLELTPDAYRVLSTEIERIDTAPRIPWGASNVVASSVVKQHGHRQEAQRALRDAIALWAGVYHARGETDTEIMRRFWFQFGIDTLTAQTLSVKDATELLQRIDNARTSPLL